MGAQAHLVELGILDPLADLSVGLTLTGLELVEHLPSTTGVGQLDAAALQLVVIAAHPQCGIGAVVAQAVDPRLTGDQRSASQRTEALSDRPGLGVAQSLLGRTQHRFTAHPLVEAGREALLRLVLVMGTNFAHTLKTESKRA
ncbi:MAG TPA: hypothetical protein VFY45_05390 [Baekduia sp.]|nr:hypothetical protein [Baekduia sp.]